eukprot:1160382-Pelagomonas_calceolata.AAC.3
MSIESPLNLNAAERALECRPLKAWILHELLGDRENVETISTLTHLREPRCCLHALTLCSFSLLIPVL